MTAEVPTTPEGPADDGTISWSELEAGVASTLQRAGVSEASIDARRIVAEAAGVALGELVLLAREPVGERAVAAVDAMTARRAAGEPLQYVLGRWGFRGLDLAVDRRVLIPRPETEQLVDVAIAHVDRVTDAGRPAVVVDLGTGSGAIGLAVAAERVRTEVWLTDRSPDALSVARANLAGLGRAGARVRVVEGDWYDALDGSLRGGIDVIVSNPPYVPSDETLPSVVADWEPATALRAGPDGLDDLRTIVEGARDWLAPGGALVVELGAEQAGVVAASMEERDLVDVEIVADLAGRPRIVHGRRR